LNITMYSIRSTSTRRPKYGKMALWSGILNLKNSFCMPAAPEMQYRIASFFAASLIVHQENASD
jgi:hypothetical protein